MVAHSHDPPLTQETEFGCQEERQGHAKHKRLSELCRLVAKPRIKAQKWAELLGDEKGAWPRISA